MLAPMTTMEIEAQQGMSPQTHTRSARLQRKRMTRLLDLQGIQRRISHRRRLTIHVQLQRSHALVLACFLHVYPTAAQPYLNPHIGKATQYPILISTKQCLLIYTFLHILSFDCLLKHPRKNSIFGIWASGPCSLVYG